LDRSFGGPKGVVRAGRGFYWAVHGERIRRVGLVEPRRKVREVGYLDVNDED